MQSFNSFPWACVYDGTLKMTAVADRLRRPMIRVRGGPFPHCDWSSATACSLGEPPVTTGARAIFLWSDGDSREAIVAATRPILAACLTLRQVLRQREKPEAPWQQPAPPVDLISTVFPLTSNI
jgi:hypothetical protein